MKAVLALAFFGLANAAIIADVPHHVLFDSAATINPAATRATLARYGLEKPVFDDDFVAFAHAVGAPDTPAAIALRDLYDEPVLLFFQDPAGEIISYYARSGIHNMPAEVRSAVAQLIGGADSYTVAYKPERVLGAFRTILPDRFFQPIADVALLKFLSDPIPTPEDPTYAFNKQEIATIFPQTRSTVPVYFDIDDLPIAYRAPVQLDVAPFAKSYVKIGDDSYYKDYTPAVYNGYTPAFYPFAKENYPREYPFFRDYTPAFYKDYTPAFYKDYTPAFYKDYTPAFYQYPKESYPREYPFSRSVIPIDTAYVPKAYPEYGFYPKSYPEFPFYPKSYPIDYYPKPFYPLGKSALPFYPKTAIPQVENVPYAKSIVQPQIQNFFYPKSPVQHPVNSVLYPESIVHPHVENFLYAKSVVQPHRRHPLDGIYSNDVIHHPELVNAEVPLNAAIKPVNVVPPAYRFLKADYPYFSATPAVDFVQTYKPLPQL